MVNIPLRFEEEGYYRISITADGTAEVKTMDIDRFTSTKAAAELWVLVTENGGQVTPDFQPEVVPSGFVPRGGPLVRRGQRIPPARQPAGALMAQSSLSNYVIVRVRTETSAGVFTTLPGTEVIARLYEPYGGQYVATSMDIADANGLVWLPCPGQEEWHVQFNLPTTSYVKKQENVGGTVIADWDCGQTVTGLVDRWHYTPRILVTEAAQRIATHTGYNRAAVHIQFNASEAASYSPSWDRISYGNAHWGSPWVLAHEYGHALANKSLGGSFTATNCDNHDIDQPSSFTCALKEGLADYLGDVGAYGSAQNWESFRVTTRAPEVEGNVAALLYDLEDGGSESGDLTDYTPNYVLTVYKTCKSNGSARTNVANFVWCLENRFNSAVHYQHFFVTGGNPSESATEPSSWNADNIRSTWLNTVGL